MKNNNPYIRTTHGRILNILDLSLETAKYDAENHSISVMQYSTFKYILLLDIKGLLSEKDKSILNRAKINPYPFKKEIETINQKIKEIMRKTLVGLKEFQEKQPVTEISDFYKEKNK